eukprot:CAMPEP_0204906856 /NCGR_PEP_ID=MMETSP1397-20131031/6192_1 /ASSEMBLY_ACC=CAM_ASM_000891 /TAXON_ID=49980 /ORGANISM="Climacostomum Climacostomum virens, Strain Stock W-24" /LENGTH=397 /DNA_ID=CAMNT_0052075861 /DNA_START=42 /DNA_END=1232 /DNA_ORIENTATION=+
MVLEHFPEANASKSPTSSQDSTNSTQQTESESSSSPTKRRKISSDREQRLPGHLSRHERGVLKAQIASLFKSGKEFLQNHRRQTVKAEKAFKQSLAPKWQALLVVAASQVVKALFRDIAHSGTEAEVLGLLKLRLQLWNLVKGLDFDKLFKQGNSISPVFQYLLLCTCLKHSKGYKKLDAGYANWLKGVLSGAAGNEVGSVSSCIQDHSKSRILNILESPLVFEAFNATYSELHFDRFISRWELKEAALPVLNKVYLLDMGVSHSIASQSLPNFITVITDFGTLPQEIKEAAIIVRFLYELSYHFQRRSTTSLSAYFNSSHSDLTLPINLGPDREMPLISAGDRLAARNLDKGFELAKTNHDKFFHSGPTLHENLFGRMVRNLGVQGALYLLDEGNW